MPTFPIDLWALARRGPISRLCLWFGLVAAVALLIQLAASLFGAGFSITSDRAGKTLLGVLMLACAVVVMSRSERPVGVYGFAIGDRWRRHAAVGMIAGGAIIAITTLAAATLAYDARMVEPARWLSAAGKALGALPLAVAAQVTFTCFVLGALLDRYRRWASIIATALLFALLFPSIKAAPGSAFPEAVLISKFMLLVVAAQLRLLTGDLVAGVGFLFGALFVERLVRKAALLGAPANETLATLIAPGWSLMESPLLWTLLSIAAAALGVMIARRRIDAPAASSTVSSAFKRVYPFATMGALAPIDVWLAQLSRARWRIGGAYIPRLIATITLSSINTILTLPERFLLPLLTRRVRVREPLFILGVHRSGTTHLQNMLALDPAFATPTTWQVMNPHGFFISGWLIKPLLALFAPWRRPMDAVRFGLDAPNEEEFAIANTSGLSADWSLRLPRCAHLYDRCNRPDEWTERERRRWRALYRRFLRVLSVATRRRLLLKNPYNTGRLAELTDMFPDARFIHIRRDPVDVYRSYLHMAREGHCLVQLQDPRGEDDHADRFLENYRAMEERFERDAADIPDDRLARIRYDDLIADPIGVIRGVYSRLGIEFTPIFEARLQAYLASVGGYQRNRHRAVSDDERERIHAAMGDLIERWERDGGRGRDVEVKPGRSIATPAGA